MGELRPRLVLVPLDERPVNTRLVEMVAAAGDASMVVAPAELLGHGRAAGPTGELAAWLLEHGADCDAVVVSVDQLVHGGLVPSRLTSDSIESAVSRLDVLRRLRTISPATRILAFSIVSRAADANDASEEPEYWATHGRAMHELFAQHHRKLTGLEDAERLAGLERTLPREHVVDSYLRRLRNHVVNLATLGLAAEGVLDALVFGSDDTAPWSAGSPEREWLSAWKDRFAIGEEVLAYPGADEIGCTLTARALLHDASAPTVVAHCAVPDGLDRTALFEDGAIGRTVELQVHAAGGCLADEGDGDLDLVVHPPAVPSGDWNWDRITGSDDAEATAQLVQRLAQAGRRVALVDVAYANGADPALMSRLSGRGLLESLAGYGAWNTAGNTIGSVVGHMCAALAGGNRATAMSNALAAHRLVEDWLYMTDVRGQIAASFPVLASRTASYEERAAAAADASAFAERRLAAAIANVPFLARHASLVPQSVSFPWMRIFEIDFRLARAGRDVTGERAASRG